jgi:hypothetical protein
MIKQLFPDLDLIDDPDMLYDIKIQIGSKKMKNPAFVDSITVNQ